MVIDGTRGILVEDKANDQKTCEDLSLPIGTHSRNSGWKMENNHSLLFEGATVSIRGVRKLGPKLSDKVLSQRLADLTSIGLVIRQKSPGQARMDLYALTPLGKSLGRVLQDLYTWGNNHAAELGVHVGNPLDMFSDAMN